MLMIMMSLMLLMSLMMMFSKHPLSAGLILILSTILIALMSSLMLQTFWFSYILILIFVGGMLILFIYLISLSPNQKFSISFSTLMMFFFMLTISMIHMIDPMMFMEMSKKIVSNLNLMLPNSIKLFNLTSSNMTLMSVNYLFLIMIIVTKITSTLEGPLRSKIKYV